MQNPVFELLLLKSGGFVPTKAKNRSGDAAEAASAFGTVAISQHVVACLRDMQSNPLARGGIEDFYSAECPVTQGKEDEGPIESRVCVRNAIVEYCTDQGIPPNEFPLQEWIPDTIEKIEDSNFFADSDNVALLNSKLVELNELLEKLAQSNLELAAAMEIPASPEAP